MDVQFVYQKKRAEFGRQCLFSDKGPDLIDNFPSDKKMLHNYILKDPVSRETQYVPVQAEHYLNTTRAEYTQSTMNHTEGGWPKDVNIADEEHTKRYRRKVEKDEGYYHTCMQLFKSMENCILQNNAINIYQQYFSDVEETPVVERSSARTVNVYQDQSKPTRPVTHISWSPDNQTKLAISHCNMTFQAVVPNETTHSYIWEVENPNVPLYVLKPEFACVCLEYNQKDPNSLVSGQFNGQVAVWDVRKGHSPVELSPLDVSFRDPVHNVLWINSKSGTEFFSSSTDGQVKWWDLRKMSEPTETLVLNLNKEEGTAMTGALGASVLEYESTIPTRFMLGCEQGVILSCNRKGKSPSEKIVGKFQAHLGPVLALQRNPAFVKNFLSVGDWTARIWAEDCRESSIMWTSFHKAMLTDGAWSPSRLSCFFVTRSDGVLDVWDILQQQKHASLAVKVCDEALSCLRTHEQGRLIAVGNKKGTTYLVELSENLQTSSKNDKHLLTHMFEREGRREKILEARNREIRLKLKGKGSAVAVETLAEDESAPPGSEGAERAVGEGEESEAVAEPNWADPNVIQAEKEYYLAIELETKGPEPPEELMEEIAEPEPEEHDVEPEPEPEPSKKPADGKAKEEKGGGKKGKGDKKEKKTKAEKKEKKEKKKDKKEKKEKKAKGGKKKK